MPGKERLSIYCWPGKMRSTGGRMGAKPSDYVDDIVVKIDDSNAQNDEENQRSKFTS